MFEQFSSPLREQFDGQIYIKAAHVIKGIELMKWFKHEVDAHEGKILAHLYRKYGLEGEARYWRLVGLLAKNFASSKKGYFMLDLDVIQARLRQKSTADSVAYLEHLAGYKPTLDQLKANDYPFIFEREGNLCRIKYDKIAKIKDNHTANLQAAGKRKTSYLALEKKKNKNNKKNQSPGADSLNPVVIGAEIQSLLRMHPIHIDITPFASEGAKKVLAKYSRSFLGDRSEFELSQLVREVLKAAKEAS